ncbi:hypothetical protein FP507_06020 [Chlorobium phaeovibrioides]|uniref:DoxX family protein n=1 Tax=Chlorobium phaeovibrioides TaxID=1094 RepID=A0A5M8IB98_CHLPH|nr:DoxX-like family protein [Chlorobium phaeovibrioides]KAA6232683.1 hypothetical protein FP507_06020 [Chlorobium phaeovibrioides]
MLSGLIRPELIHGSPMLWISRVALAFSWIYQGAVPKLACRSSGEVELLGHLIPVYRWACMAVSWMGVAEIMFGLLLLVSMRYWVFWFNMMALAGLLLFVALFEPAMLTLPFNPLTLNVALIALSLVALLELKKQKNNSHAEQDC